MPFFSVIIVNYNAGAYLQRAVGSLRQQSFRDFECLLVDNASSDGSADEIDASGVPGYRFMPQDENLGFAAGNNLGAREATGRWIVLLNPDAEAEVDWLQRLHDAISRHPGTAMFASAQISLDDPDRLDGVGDAYHLWGIPWRGGFGRPVSELPGEGLCFSPCGAGAVIASDLFNRLGGFDERFFCFCEDVDLGFRAQLMGERSIFLPDAVIRHKGGGTAGRVSAFALEHGSRNRIWVLAKNMPWPLLVVSLPGHVLMSVLILARGFTRGHGHHVWRGMMKGLRGISAIRAPSTWQAPERNVGLWPLARAMAWNPLRMLQRKSHIRRTGR